jgi:hypothetical protein
MSKRCEFHVHLTDRTSSIFVLSDAAVIDDLLQSKDPPKFFSQTNIAFKNAAGVTLIPVSAIARLDVKANPPAGWKMHLPASATIKIISQEEFKGRYKPYLKLEQTRRKFRETGQAFQGFAYLRLADNQRVVLEISSEIPTAIEQRGVIESLLKAPALFFEGAGGVVSFVNPANVIRIDLLPGMPEIAPAAWAATEKSGPSKQ